MRALLLNCLTRDYGELWGAAWEEGYRGDGWLSSDARLTRWADHLEGGREWAWGTPLRTALDRRQALVELDVLAARELGLRLEDLLLMYRVGFAVLRKYDGETYYDMNGRCVFSVKGGESPLTRAEWEGIRDLREGEYVKKVTETAWGDEPREREVRYRAPFFRKDREADYREAWGRLEGADAGVK